MHIVEDGGELSPASALRAYMARVYRGERMVLTPVLARLERLTYRALRVNPERGQGLEGLRQDG